MRYRYVVGIDVGKRFLQVSIFDGETYQDFTVKNEPDAFLGEVRKRLPEEVFPETLFLMEATGIYHLRVATALFEEGYQVGVLNPFLVRKYMELCFTRVKTDRADARCMARFGFTMDVSLFTPRDQKAEELRQVLHALDRYQRELRQVENRLEALNKMPLVNPRVRQCYEEDRMRIKSRVRELEQEAERLSSQYAREDYERLQGIPGIGKRCAAALLGFLNRMERFARAKEVAQFIGLSPQIHQSGERPERAFLSKRGNGYLRKLLYLWL